MIDPEDDSGITEYSRGFNLGCLIGLVIGVAAALWTARFLFA